MAKSWRGLAKSAILMAKQNTIISYLSRAGPCDEGSWRSAWLAKYELVKQHWVQHEVDEALRLHKEFNLWTIRQAFKEFMLPVGISAAICCTAAACSTGSPRFRISETWSCCALVNMVSRVPLILYLIWNGQRIVVAKGQDNIAPFFRDVSHPKEIYVLACRDCQGDVAFFFR